MSLAFASELEAVPPTRVGVPVVPHWTLPRPELDRRLDRGAEGVLTVVTGPAGSGKTLGVASWAAGRTSPSGIVWVNLSRGGGEPERIWRLIRNALRQAGEQHLPAAPAADASDRERSRALVAFADALSTRGPWTVVLDGFPTGTPSGLGREIEIVLDHSGRSLRMVLMGHGPPAVDLNRFAAAGELVEVTAADLLMDTDEITGALRLGNAPHDPRTVSAVASHSLGWACGVRLAAMSLASLERSADLAMALHETDRAIHGYLAHEVLARLSAPVRRLVVLTSLDEVVDPGAVLAALGPRAGTANDRMIDDTGLIERLGDGSLVCHPLLRAAARAELELGPTGGPSAGHHKLARWYAGHGAPRTAVELCLAVRDWGRAAAVLVESHFVPQLVAFTADDTVVRAACRPELQAAEPLLLAAVALRRRDALAAELALTEAMSERSPTSARRLACAFVQLGIARLEGRAPADAGLIASSRSLVAESAVEAVVALSELSASLDGFAGAVEVSTGDVESALVTLSRGAERSSTDCVGQLAVLEAHRGDLRAAERHARLALREGSADAGAGAAHAAVALAWVSVDRGALDVAQAFLDDAVAGPWASEPWLLVVHEVVRARLLIASGRPDEATRRLVAPARALTDREAAAWIRELVTSVGAEALLASGEPQQALALVTLGLPTGSPDRAVLTARACRDIGDVRGAGAAMASVIHSLHATPRSTQLPGLVLEAQLAHDRGQVERAVALVERALRCAGDEDNRRPLVPHAAWLRWFLDRDGSALREFRPFVTSLLGGDGATAQSRSSVAATPHVVLEPLTERETQVLELLAQMCSTDEIAAELFVSANTVKTHLKGIFRKYSVNRRVDAVRRGRELGLC